MAKAVDVCLCMIVLIGIGIGSWFLSSEALAVGEGQIIVEDADYVSHNAAWYSADLTNTAANVTPRIVVEYADSIFEQVSQNVIAPNISPRIVVEYADSIFEQVSQSVITPDISPRILVEYADSIFSADLERTAPPGPDFSITTSPSSLSIHQGSYSLSAITVTSQNCFNQPVNVEVSTPYGVGITLLPSQVTPPPDGSVAATVIVQVSAFSAPGNHVLTVIGTSGASTHTTNLSLEITRAPSTEWTFAIITDIHMGYSYTDYGTPGWDDSGGDNYALTDRLTMIVDWINSNKDSNNIRFVVVLGDISDSGEKSELIKARDILNGLSVPYIPVIGNHDIWPYTQQVGTTDTWRNEYYWQDCRTTKPPFATISDYNETLPPIGDQFFDEVFWPQDGLNRQKIEALFGASWKRQTEQNGYNGLPHLQNCVFTYEGVKFIAADFVDRDPKDPPQSEDGRLYPDTANWLSDNLMGGQSTILFSHHAIEGFTAAAWIGNNRSEVTSIIRQSGCDFQGNFAGHNHRNADFFSWPSPDIKSVTTEAVCRESISWVPDVFGQGLVTREKKNIRLVSITLNGRIKDYRTQQRIDDNDMVVPHAWDPKTRLHSIWGNCPIDLEVTDPDGFTVTKQTGTVAGMSYFEGDWDCDGTLDDMVLLDFQKVGNYTIHVIPEPGTMPNETYTLRIFGTEEVTFLVKNESIAEIPSEPFIANSTLFTLTAHPTTSIAIGEPKIINDAIHVSPSTPIDFTASDNLYGSGLASTAYRIYNATFDTGWTIYTKPVYLLGLSEGTYQIDYNSTDCAGNLEPTNTVAITLANPNIEVTGMTLSKTVVGQGFNIHVNITVRNLGIFSENFTNVVYANTTAIGTQETSLASDALTTMTFAWNTSSFAKGSYIIITYAEPIIGEASIIDNSQSGGIVIVTLQGDVNGDYRVDVTDLTDLKMAYGSTHESLIWNSNADVNGDSKVDVRDIFLHGKNYGEVDP
jgi:hypothetical protein